MESPEGVTEQRKVPVCACHGPAAGQPLSGHGLYREEAAKAEVIAFTMSPVESV